MSSLLLTDEIHTAQKTDGLICSKKLTNNIDQIYRLLRTKALLLEDFL
jgi:hypothetical protein